MMASIIFFFIFLQATVNMIDKCMEKERKLMNNIITLCLQEKKVCEVPFLLYVYLLAVDSVTLFFSFFLNLGIFEAGNVTER